MREKQQEQKKLTMPRIQGKQLEPVSFAHCNSAQFAHGIAEKRGQVIGSNFPARLTYLFGEH